MRNLETSLDVTKKKLKEEARLRRQAELAQVEIETRYKESQSLRDENELLRDENEALREELSFKCRELDNYKNGDQEKMKQLDDLSQIVGSIQRRGEERSTIGGASTIEGGTDAGHNDGTEITLNTNTRQDTNMDDSYAEVLDELETVTEQLIATQQKLWKTEDKLRESDAKVRELNYKLKRGKSSSSGDTITVNSEADNNAMDTTSQTEKRLMDELSLVRDELAMAQEELKATEEQAASYQERLRTLGETNERGGAEHRSRINDLRSKVKDLEEISKEAEEQIAEYEDLLEESRTENVKLMEEITCLRDLLPDGGASLKFDEQLEDLKEKVTQETRATVLHEANQERERELKILREKFKKIFKENATLREQVKHLESGLDQALVEENERLNKKLQTSKEDHRSAIKRLEKATAQSAGRQEDYPGQTTDVIETLEQEVKSLADEKYYLQEKVKSLERVLQSSTNEKERFNQKSKLMQTSLRSSRDEILKLKKKTGHLAAELENSRSIASKLDRDSDSLRKKYASVKAELDVSRSILEDAGLEEETIARSDTTEMKQKIILLSDSLDTIRADYDYLMAELAESKKHLCDTQEEAKKQAEDQIEDFKSQIEKLEEKLEDSRLERAELVRELEEANSKASQQSQTEERMIVMDKFSKINEEKNDLEKRLKEADSTILSIRETVSSLTKQLRDCQKEKAELEYSLNSGNFTSSDRMQALEKIFSDNPKTREALDPEPVENKPSGLKGFFNWYGQDSKGNMENHINTRDPPTTRSVAKSAISVASSDSSFGVLREQLAELTRENEMLKNKVIDLASNTTKASSNDDTGNLRDQVNALQICLENAEYSTIETGNLEQRLKNAESRLLEKEEDMQKMERNLEVSKEHSDSLIVEISALNDTLANTRHNLGIVKIQLEETTRQKKQLQEQLIMKDKESIEDARRILASEQEEEFEELKLQLKKLTEEKSALQHQVDDSKIALSVSQYAQERNKEERKEYAAKLDAATEEIDALKNEATRLEGLRGSPTGAGAKNETVNLTKQLQQLSDENNGLQQMVTELEESLQTSQDELNKKSESVRSLEKSLVSTQEETRMLSDELSSLSQAFEDAKKEYDAVVDELEAVNELFDEARQEAERSGREAAEDEVRSEMIAAQEHERNLMKEQVQRILDENESLQEQVNEARRPSTQARDPEAASGEAELARQEVEILKEALRSTSENVKSLKEKELHLTLSLREAKEELKHAQDELNLKIQKYNPGNTDDEVYSCAAHSSAESSTEYMSLRDQFKKLIENCDQENPTLASSEAEAGYKAEGLRLKVELMDMSMSLEKLMKENMMIEEELVRLKTTSREMCVEAERQGRMNATKAVRAELKAERDLEMEEFKEKFNELVVENSALEQKAQDATIALNIAKVSQDRKLDDLNELEDELAKSRKEARKLKEEIFNMTVELERSKRGHAQDPITSDHEEHIKGLNSQLCALNIENAALQAKLRSAGPETKPKIGHRNKAEINALLDSLRESRETIGKLEERIQLLNLKMSTLKDENSALSGERDRLERELAARDKIPHNNSESEANFLRKELETFVKEKASLQKQVDDANINLSLSKLSSRSMTQGSGAEISSTNQGALTNIGSELQKAKSEIDATNEVLGQVNDTLSSIEAVLSSKEETREAAKKTLAEWSDGTGWIMTSADSSQNAEKLKRRMHSVATMILKSKREYAAALSELETVKEKIGETCSNEKSHDPIQQNYRSALTVGKDTELKVLREQISVLTSQNTLLEKRIEGTEKDLKLAHETTEKQKIDLELSEMKYEESKKDAKKSKDEVSRLQSTLEGAQNDHRALRKQLETLNTRVGELCREAEERGKAAAAEELRVGIRSLKEQERKELLNQFNLFYQENLDLQAKLDETEAALAESKERHEIGSSQIELAAKTALEKAEKRAEVLEATNKRLKQELDSLKQVADVDKPPEEAANVSTKGSRGREAELRLLQDQFKKLSAKSAALGQKVEDAENAVASVRGQQGKTLAATETNSRLAEKLKITIEKTADEVEDLSVTMENKVAVTEESMAKLEKEISVAKGALQVSQAGYVALKRGRGKAILPPSSSAVSNVRESVENSGGDIRKSISLDRPSCESRDDHSSSQKRSRSYSPAPKADPTPGNKPPEGNSRKMEILNRIDQRNAQRKIFGNDGKPVARGSPFAKRMAHHARRLELNREKLQITADPVVSDASAKDRSE